MFLDDIRSSNQTTRKLSLLLLCALLRDIDISNVIMRQIRQPKLNSLILLDCSKKRMLSDESVVFLARKRDSLLRKASSNPQLLLWHLTEEAQQVQVEFVQNSQISRQESAKSLEIVPDPINSTCGGFFCFGKKELALKFTQIKANKEKQRPTKIQEFEVQKTNSNFFQSAQNKTQMSVKVADLFERRKAELQNVFVTGFGRRNEGSLTRIAELQTQARSDESERSRVQNGST